MGNTAEADSGRLFKILPDREGIPNHNPTFDRVLAEHGCGLLTRSEVVTLQINVGKRCNQACHHCHVDAGPKRSEMMREEVAERLLELLAASPSIRTVDITGGAPELNPNFRRLVIRSRESGREVIDRCNLTILEVAGQEDLAEFLQAQQVEVVASLPCYLGDNVDRQRGKGVFESSIRSLRHLNGLGYGREGTGYILNLVYNPQGPSLPPPQDVLEEDYRRELGDKFGIVFNRLFTLANMPIQRFGSTLITKGEFDRYMSLLRQAHRDENLDGVMCRDLVSVDWRGYLYDCDFNQMLDLPLSGPDGTRRRLEDLLTDDLDRNPITVAGHCYGCTAGQGSSCGGALKEAAE